MAHTLARKSVDEDGPAASNPAPALAGTTTRAASALDPLILALARAVDRKAAGRPTEGPTDRAG